MSEFSKQMKPIIEQPQRRGALGILFALTLFLVGAGISIYYMPPKLGELTVLAILVFLAVTGVFSLFIYAIGIVGFYDSSQDNMIASQINNGLGDGLLVNDLAGRISYANSSYGRLTGAQGAEELNLVERLFSKDPEASEIIFRMMQKLREGIASEEVVRLSMPLNRENDNPCWYRMRARALLNPQAPLSERNNLVLWGLTDITRYRESIEDSFQKLQQAITFLDHAPVGFFSANPGGELTYFNATFGDWLGYDLAKFGTEILSFQDIMRSSDAALVSTATANDGKPRTEIIDVDLIKRNGQSFPVRLYHRVPYASNGRAGESRTAVIARSELIGDQDPVTLLEVRFARFFNSSPIAIATLNGAGNIIRTNGAFAKLFSLPVGDTSGHSVVLADLVEETYRGKIRSALSQALVGQGNIDAVEVQLDDNHKLDGERYAQFFFAHVPRSENDGDISEQIISYILETTEQRQLEHKFAQSQKMQAVGKLAGGIAHDFNNVLQAIIGFSDLLLQSHRPTDSAHKDIMNIKQNANRAAGLVRQLLAFSRRQTLRPIRLNLNEAIAELDVMLKRLIDDKMGQRKNTRFAFEPGVNIWPVMADLGQLEQVITNLVVNASDAIEPEEEGRIIIETRNVGFDEQNIPANSPGLLAGEYVLISVSDNGSGIPAEIREKIFDPFFSTKEVGEGTGLGLSTVYGIIKQSEGYIFVDSEPGSGTVFRIYFPRLVEEEGSSADENLPAEEEVQDLSGDGVILLVEDEESVRAFASRALEARGYQVLIASTGQEALDIINEEADKIDLIVSDVVMPEMDGPTLLGEVRKKYPEIKVIFVSGFAEEAFDKHLPGDQQFEFLAKPFTLKQLATKVKEVLATPVS